jgi:hypothetical protein
VEASLDLAEARQRVEAAFGEERAPQPSAAALTDEGDHDRQMARAKDLTKRAERLAAGNIGDDDREDLDHLLGLSLTAIKARDFDALRDCSDQLEDILFYLED